MARLLLALATLLITAACSDERGTEAPAIDPNAPRYAADSATQGTIKIVVEYEGEAPAPEVLTITSDQQVCDATLLSERWVVTEGRVANCFVFIESGLPEMNFPAEDAPVVFDQKKCRYEPHVAGVRTGQPLKVQNSDPTYHNVLGSPRANEKFNVGMGPGAEPLDFVFPNPDRMKFTCSVHPWMTSWLHVVPHPFFATTNKEGTATLNGVPAGEYQIQIWHEALQKDPPKRTVQVKAGETTELVVRVAAP